jgi:hypothetical protein
VEPAEFEKKPVSESNWAPVELVVRPTATHWEVVRGGPLAVSVLGMLLSTVVLAWHKETAANPANKTTASFIVILQYAVPSLL